jgi:predicted deacylase
MKKLLYIFLFIFIFVPSILAGGADSNTYSSKMESQSVSQAIFGLNDEYETPYYILHGRKTTPVMLVHGGMHGDEIASYLACDEILKNISILEGTLVIIPKLNKKACDLNTRYINVDLNHAFPGDITSDTYEYRLAHELMYLVDSLKPDLIINLHEALTKYDSEAEKDSEKAYGQIVITCLQPFQDMLVNAVTHMNDSIPAADQKFHPHYYSFREWSSLDNFVSKFDITSYTVETYRGFNIDTRVKLQQIAVLQFMKELGIKYEYPALKLD